MSANAIHLMSGLTDVELMVGLKKGDEDFMEPLLKRHRHAVVHFIYGIVLNAAVAEELAQDVFLSVYHARGRYEPSANFTTWLYRIARNRSLNWLRDNRHSRNATCLDPVVRRHAAPSATPEQQMIRHDLHRRVRGAVDALPARQRDAVLLHKFSGLDYIEIATVLGCSLTAVKALLNRAYCSLRKSLATC